jgi:C4-dicarboxylate transporter, DctM subunit
MGWVMVLLPVILLVLGFPVFLILLTTSAVVLLFFVDIPATAVHQVMFGSIDKFALLAVPFFIFAGELMSRGGVSHRIVRWVTSIIGSVQGSLPLTALGTATVFGAISGSTAATVAAVGSLTYDPLRKAGYSEKFSTGLLTSAGAISNIIPPSIAMILYGAAAQQSVVELFAAGIFPGLVIALLFGLYIYIHAKRAGIREVEKFSLAEFFAATRDGIWAIIAPIIILGGIYTGVFSPTEAAGVASVYAIFTTVLVYREITLHELFDVAARSMYLTAQIFIIVAVAGVYSWLLTVSGAANAATEFIGGLEMQPWMILLIINIFLLLIGTVLDTASAILVLTPLLVPIATAAGVDLVHFGIIIVVNLSIGTFTPPFGLNIFVGQAIFKAPLSSIYPGLVPFISLSIIGLLFITYVPDLSLWILKYIG